MNKFKYITTLGCIAVGVPTLLVVTMIVIGISVNLNRSNSREETIVKEVKQSIEAPVEKRIETVKTDTQHINVQHKVEVKPTIINLKKKDTLPTKDTLQTDTLIEDYADTTELLHD